MLSLCPHRDWPRGFWDIQDCPPSYFHRVYLSSVFELISCQALHYSFPFSSITAMLSIIRPCLSHMRQIPVREASRPILTFNSTMQNSGNVYEVICTSPNEFSKFPSQIIKVHLDGLCGVINFLKGLFIIFLHSARQGTRWLEVTFCMIWKKNSL